MVVFEMTPNCMKVANDSTPQLLRNLVDKMIQNDQVLEMLRQLYEEDAKPVQVRVLLKRDGHG